MVLELSLLIGNYQVGNNGYCAMMRERNKLYVSQENTDALVDLDRDYAAYASAGRHWSLASDTCPVMRYKHHRGAERQPAGARTVTREVDR